MITEVKPKVILEVGSWRGASALHMASLCDAEIYCVDTWLGGIDHLLGEGDPQNDLCRDEYGSPMLYHQFLVNVASSGSAARIHPLQQTSLNGMRMLKFAGVQPDLIYLDGSHHEDDVFQDLRCARANFPKVSAIFGDDATFIPVANAVNGFAKANSLTVELEKDFWRLREKVSGLAVK